MFRSARLVYEEYEFFESIFGKALMEQGCTPEMIAQYPICKDINDRKDAALLVGKMFLDILKTPDLTCAVADESAPTETKKLVKLVEIYKEKLQYNLSYVPTSCFDENVVAAFFEDKLIVKGEAGKFFNSIKDPNPIYPYATDIAVRGTWADKLLAMKMLTERYFGNSSTEELQGSLSDITSIKAELMNYIEHITLGTSLDNPIFFKTQLGEAYAEKYAIDSSYVIPEQPLMSVIRFLGLPSDSNVELNKQELFTAAISNQTSDIAMKNTARDFIHSFGVFRTTLTQSYSANDMKILNSNESVYIATKRNKLAWHMIDSSLALGFLSTLDPQVILKVYKIKTGNFEFPADFTIEEQRAAQIPLMYLEQLYSLALQNAPLTEEMLVEQIGEESGKLFYAAFLLGPEKLLKVINFIKVANTAPSNADEDTKKLYALDVQILADFLTEKLPAKVELYLKTLDYLPALIR